MDDFNKDYKDAKKLVIIGGVLYLLDRFLPDWIKGLFSIFLSIVLILGAIALWRAGFYGDMWEYVIGPLLKLIWSAVQLIFYWIPVNLVCYVFSGGSCTALPAIH